MTQPRWQPWVADPAALDFQCCLGLAAQIVGAGELSVFEVVARVAARLVEYVGQDVGAVGRQAFAGDRVFAQPFDELAVGITICIRVFGRTHLHAGIVEDDRLDPLGAHDRADAAAPAVTGRTQFRVGAGDGGRQQLALPGRTDGHVGHLVAVFRAQLLYQRVVVQQLEAVVDDDLDSILVDKDLVEVVTFRLPFQDDGGVAEPGQHLGGLAAGVGLLDGAGQRAFAADRQPAGHRTGGAAQHTG